MRKKQIEKRKVRVRERTGVKKLEKKRNKGIESEKKRINWQKINGVKISVCDK